MLNEADFLLATGGETDIDRSSMGDGMNERIREWLATPEGTLLGAPSWGNNLLRYKFEPLSDVGQIISMSIAQKLPQDIEGLRLVAISVTKLGVDMVRIVIRHQYGTSESTVDL